VTEPRWYAVVLSWNGRDDTLRCLDSLARVSDPPIRVVCVDNGSSDGSVEAIRERHPGVHLIENGTNLGYSGGNNVGLRWALEQGARWIVLVNNDAVVADDAFAGFDQVAAEHPRAGALAGKLYIAEPSDRIWFAGQRYLTWLGYSGRARGLGRRDSARYRRVVPTDRAAGALMAVSRPAIDRAGLLDDDLFAYAEDVDWSLRIREAGFEVLVAPGARAWHRVAGSTGGEASTHNLYYGTRNNIVVCERHRPLPGPLASLRRLVVLATFAAHALKRPNRRAALAAVREGYRDARAGRLGERGASAGSLPRG
jgi:GT2 family glycosyltransferase